MIGTIKKWISQDKAKDSLPGENKDSLPGETALRFVTGNDLWVHAIDLQGYGTQQFAGAKTNIIAGWSEKVFDFINLAEQGESTLEKTIKSYTW